jgi:hypothetical protein
MHTLSNGKFGIERSVGKRTLCPKEREVIIENYIRG